MPKTFMPAPQAMGSLTTPTSNPSLRRGTSSPRLDTTTIRTCWTVKCVGIQQTVGAGLDGFWVSQVMGC